MKKQNTIEVKRVGLLDDIRGLCIIGVVVFHAIYDLSAIFNITIKSQVLLAILSIVQPLGSGAFVFISGIVSRYSRNNIKRGIVTISIGSLISVITILVTNFTGMDIAIRFGILSLLGSGMLLFGILQAVFQGINNLRTDQKITIISFVLLIILFLVTYHLPDGYLSFLGLKLAELPDKMYSYYYLYPLGFSTSSFTSTDYFPLFPWFFLFFAGTFLGVYAKENKFPNFAYKSYLPLFNKVGKYSLLIYVIHQPVLMMGFGLFFWILQS